MNSVENLMKQFNERFSQSPKQERYYWCRSHAKRICKGLGKYHDLYVQTNTFLLADVFENFQNMCLKIYQLDPACLFTATGLA